jgi:hypothetical protein
VHSLFKVGDCLIRQLVGGSCPVEEVNQIVYRVAFAGIAELAAVDILSIGWIEVVDVGEYGLKFLAEFESVATDNL